jgi:hypothetical protein
MRAQRWTLLKSLADNRISRFWAEYSPESIESPSSIDLDYSYRLTRSISTRRLASPSTQLDLAGKRLTRSTFVHISWVTHHSAVVGLLSVSFVRRKLPDLSVRAELHCNLRLALSWKFIRHDACTEAQITISMGWANCAWSFNGTVWVAIRQQIHHAWLYTIKTEKV